MALFGGKKEEKFEGLLGVDIGPSGIKMVELTAEQGRLRLSTYGYAESAQAKGESENFLANPDKAVDAMRRIMKDSGMKATRAVAALPSSSVFQAVITIPVPKNAKEDVKPMIESQAAKVLPMPIAEMIVDSTILDKDLLPKPEKTGDKKAEEKAEEKTEGDAAPAAEEKKAKHIRVLVTAAPKTLVEKYVDLFRKAKIDLVSLETEVFALVRSLIGKDKSRVMLVDAGLLSTNIAIVEKGIPYLTRSMKGGGVAVTQALAQSLGMNYEDAERMKRDLAVQDSTEPPKVIKEAIAPFVHELRYALELYAQQEFHDNSTVEKMILTGGTANIPALDPYLTKELDVNVYVGDPWARIAAPPALRPVLEEIGPRFAVALGLAMRLKEET